MKKYLYLGAGLCMALAISSCRSSESAYKKAYDKAKQQEGQNYLTNTPVTPVKPATPVVPKTPPTTAPSSDYVNSASVRSERVTLVSGSGLSAYSVVCGSFSVRANAEGLQQRLNNAGYRAQVVMNPSNNMYRVIATTYSDKSSAVVSRDQLRETYSDAWLLYNQ